MQNSILALLFFFVPIAGTGDPPNDNQKPVYQEACDGSAAIPIGERFLLVAEDEGELLRLYSVDGGTPVGDFQLTPTFLKNDDETDLEGATRVGTRAYWITSHGRKSSGKLDRNRYRFFATDLSGSGPDDFKVQPVGSAYERLVEDMLNEDSWEEPNPYFLQLLQDRTQLDRDEVKWLAPKKFGLNIEGLAASPSGKTLWIGLRNPLVGGKAVLIPLLNADEVIQGGSARFGAPVLIPLQGRGIRSIEYSPSRNSYLIIAGPTDGGSGFLFAEWYGCCQEEPVVIAEYEAEEDVNPEAIVIWPGRREAHLLFDEGSRMVGEKECKKKKVPKAQKSFRGDAHILNRPRPE